MRKFKLHNRTLWLGHLPWKINVVDKADLPDNCVGRCSGPYTATIEVCEQGGLEDVDTLLHEVIHAMDFAYNLKLSESQVERLGEMMTLFLRDNSWINTYLKEKTVEEYNSVKKA
jgi:hypothetical protein